MCKLFFPLQQATYDNCTCVEDNLRRLYSSSSRNYTEDDIAEQSVVSEGACDNGCRNLAPYLIVSIIALLLVFIIVVPNIFVTIRLVFMLHGPSSYIDR